MVKTSAGRRFFLMVALWAAADSLGAEEPGRLDAFDLMRFRAGAEVREVTSAAEWGKRREEIVRGLDLLESLTFVKAGRGFGAIGHSLGGHNAIYTAVFDERISVVVSSCGFDSFPDYYGGGEERWFFGQGWCQTRYMPQMSNYRGRLGEIPFDFPELLGALAPRPVFVNAPLRDANFQWESVERCVEAAHPVYALLGGDGKLVVEHPDAEHSFPEAEREKAYGVIEYALGD